MTLENTNFHGGGYEESKDQKRLVGQLKKVHDFMLDFKKHTLAEISEATGAPESSISAALRTLRNQHGFCIEKQRTKENGGTWRYWIAGGGMGEYSRKNKNKKEGGVNINTVIRDVNALQIREIEIGLNWESYIKRSDVLEILSTAQKQSVHDDVKINEAIKLLLHDYERQRKYCIYYSGNFPDSNITCHAALESRSTKNIHPLAHDLAVVLDNAVLLIKVLSHVVNYKNSKGE